MEKKRYQPSALRLLRWVVEDKNWDLLNENGFTDADFFGNGKQVLDYIRNFYGEHLEFPSVEVIEEETTVQFPKETPKSYAVTALKKHIKTKKLSKLNEQSLNFLSKNDPDAAAEVLITGLQEILPPSQGESFKETGQERFETYVESKKFGLNGIRPPYPTLRESLRVWEYSTHNVFLGITGAGKTWASAQSALYAAYGGQKAKVLLVSMENSARSVESRLDALYHSIPFGDIISKEVDMRKEKQWKDNVPNLENEEGDITVVDETSVRTVGDIYQLYLSLKPDFIIIDGAYRLTTSANASGFDNTTNVLNELHHCAAISKAAWLSTSQLDGKAMDVSGSREMAFKARFSQRFYTDPATVVCLLSSAEDLLMNICTYHIAKIRDSGDLSNVKMVFKVHADRQRMNYNEVTEDYQNQEILNETI